MSDVFKYVVFGLYAIVLIVFFGLIIWSVRKQEENRKRLQADLKSKLESGFNLTSQDIVLIGRAHNLSPSNSRLALYRVYKDISDSGSFEKLKKLVSEIHKEEPFDTMPDEVKPSLSRILELTSNTTSETDKHLLTPVTNLLTKYQELVEEQRKTKKQATIAYLITIVSFVIGAVSLYYAITAPTAADIATQLSHMP
ncbi:conserved hypothetical protein [Vibrio crassostreae]|uniref:heme exporter protein CcmD n=1 Tax=Vibrio crassostreae TaxID=246167 RepID=UPI00105180D3|nr:heme exporter protein CcmD [Vibrio crassostreae]TCT74071.1 hypothetical protein EDB46_107139 [Vibrio crassostreae]CAK1861907.1 conserved hypothetical protein [Vibrio crassostreae]CAK2069342.1 conserved hypothetical protein [Vibrio crassostreae]CAK2076647.1 conserved hypothetical protein [Vibrio crassostreae]CAK2149852.1 conserved hypothetical protein [Vibrio crassostreae]